MYTIIDSRQFTNDIIQIHNWHKQFTIDSKQMTKIVHLTNTTKLKTA